ncbi:hypothetical protein Gotri_014757 [Gossypium trilobum]|uniref:Putative plant transposon protein domain-containing protein n=1 Tax=Gossypium trilobum TaxID=34281 RepID=A0A7J9DXW1_9ROSI|nr:hypothetical protein [Gossypium trilobum]
MSLREKIWMKFICSRIWRTTDLFDISLLQSILVYVILQNKQICIGTCLYPKMIECVRNQAKGTFFPHLIMELCNRAGVPMD